MSSRIRLDSLLFARGLAPSRTAAQSLVLAGKVRVDGRVETKCGRAVAEDAAVEVEAPQRFVSRGGEKLEGAFEKFSGWTVEGLVCLDVGSSTGGFTDCMLQHGAARVMAVHLCGERRVKSAIPALEKICAAPGTSEILRRSAGCALSRIR